MALPRDCVLAERARRPPLLWNSLTLAESQLLHVLRRYTHSSASLSTHLCTEPPGEPPYGAAEQPEVQPYHILHTAAHRIARLHMPCFDSTPCHAAARPPLRLAAAPLHLDTSLTPRFATFPRRRPYARYTWTLTARLGSIVAYSPSCARWCAARCMPPSPAGARARRACSLASRPARFLSDFR